MRKVLALCLALSGCGKTPKPEPQDPDQTVEERYAEAEARLKSNFLQNGFVVSRHSDGSPERQGEGLLWSGVYLSVADCSDTAVEDTLIASILDHDGALIRISPLGEYEAGRQVTLDGAIGLYRGIASRQKRCSGAREKWSHALDVHQQYVTDHGGSLNVNSTGVLPPGFGGLPSIVAGNTGKVVFHLQAELVGWVHGTVATKSSAYRVNLAFLVAQTLADSGYGASDTFHNAFCSASDGVDIPTVDHWCGRGDLQQWIDDFEYNVWEYRHQRSGSWETPDGNGLQTPALDFLVAVRQLYKA